MVRTAILISIASLACVATRVSFGGENATSLIHRGEVQMRGRTAQALLTMKISRPDFTRTLDVRAWTAGADQALVEILAPKKEEGTSSLRTSSLMWNYFPNTDQTVRVPPSLMLQSWMGSDFTNDDLMKSSSIARDYTHRYLPLAPAKVKAGLRLVECMPRKDAVVVWGKIQQLARASDGLPVEQRFFDDDGKLVRTVKFSRFENIDGRVVPMQMAVFPADDSKQYTVIRYKKLMYDRKIPASIFNMNTLRENSHRGKLVATQWFQQRLPGSRMTASAGKPRVKVTRR